LRLQGPHGVHRLADMRVGGKLSAEDVADDSLAVDHVGDAAGDDAERFRHAKRLAERAVGVARQKKRQAMTGGEVFVRRIGITADADDRGARLEELFVGVAKGAGFLRADGGVVFGVEEEDDDMVAIEIGERDARAVVEREGDVRGAVAGMDGRHCIFVPEGRPVIAQRFNAGLTVP
jgi:hypothetical protein